MKFLLNRLERNRGGYATVLDGYIYLEKVVLQLFNFHLIKGETWELVRMIKTESRIAVARFSQPEERWNTNIGDEGKRGTSTHFSRKGLV